MPTPRNDTYTALSGAGIYAGIQGPPAWANGSVIGTWMDIPNTAGGTGAWPVSLPEGMKTDAFSGYTLKKSTSELVIACAGGHTDSPSNACISMKLTDNAPVWTTQKTSSYAGTPGQGPVDWNVTYYASGDPAARHTYSSTFFIDSINCLLLGGARYAYGNTFATDGSMALFDMTTKVYRPRNTWTDITPDANATAGFVIAQDGNGDLWTQNGYKFTVATTSWSKPGSGTLLRYPAAYDSTLDKLFALQFGGAEGDSPGLGLQAKRLDPATGNGSTITWSAGSSAAVSQLTSDAPAYAAMAYCPDTQKFYFLNPARPGTFYRITPNTGTVWDMDLYTPSGSVGTSPNGYLGNRLHYVPALKGFVLQLSMFQNLKYLRMA